MKLKLVTDSLSLSASCHSFHTDVALYSQDLWPLVVGSNGMLNMSDRVHGCPADLFAKFDVKYAGRTQPVIQLNTKTASRNYRLLLGWEPAQAF